MAEALIVLTGSNVWTMKDGSPHPTGFWAREFIEAHDAFTEGGLGVWIATPLGVKPTVDQLSWSTVGFTPSGVAMLTSSPPPVNVSCASMNSLAQ